MDTGILPPELRSTEQLLASDTTFTVPLYQRSFAWGSDEIEELWEDLTSASKRKADYFLGTIVLHKKDQKRFEIIDGQQRLTCLSLIFFAIRNYFKAHEDTRHIEIFKDFLGAKGYSKNSPVKPKLVLNKENDETFVSYLVDNKNLEEVNLALKGKKISSSNKLLLAAYKYFLEQITLGVLQKGSDGDEFLVPLIDCLRSSIKLIAVTVLSEEDANLFFESLNARGKELAVSDLVKNRLYLEAKDQISRAQGFWEKMEADLGNRPIPEFLRHYWIAKKIEEKSGTVREKQLYRMIAKEVKDKPSTTIALLKDLFGTASDYSKISDFNLWPDEEVYDQAFEESLKDLKLFRIAQCHPILINAIQVFNRPRDVAKTFRIVANFSFRYFIVGNQSPGNLERVSNSIAIGIRTGRISKPRDVASEFLSVNPDAAFRSDFSLVAFPKSRAKIARYTLSKLSNYLGQRSSKTGGELIANPNTKQLNLEHILPQSCPSTWTANFGPDADPKEYVHRLGNLTMLNAKINRDIADKSIADKRKIAFVTSNLAINQSLKIVKGWSEKEIESRQLDLAKSALEVWKI